MLGQRGYLVLAQRWLPTLGQRHFAHRPYVGPTGWHDVGPTWVCYTLPLGQRWANVGLYYTSVGPMLGQCGCYTCMLYFHCANVGPTWVCTTLPLGQRWANVGLYYTSVGPMLGQCGCYTCMLYFHCANVGSTWVCTTLPLGQCGCIFIGPALG